MEEELFFSVVSPFFFLSSCKALVSSPTRCFAMVKCCRERERENVKRPPCSPKKAIVVPFPGGVFFSSFSLPHLEDLEQCRIHSGDHHLWSNPPLHQHKRACLHPLLWREKTVNLSGNEPPGFLGFPWFLLTPDCSWKVDLWPRRAIGGPD